MKNREVPRFELTRTARAAPICPPSFRSPVSINRLRGRGRVAEGLRRERTGKIATPVSIRWPLPHLGEIVKNAQFKTVASFLDRFAINSRLSLKRISLLTELIIVTNRYDKCRFLFYILCVVEIYFM